MAIVSIKSQQVGSMTATAGTCARPCSTGTKEAWSTGAGVFAVVDKEVDHRLEHV